MGKTLKIKVCGMRDAGNLEQVCRLRPDMIGFIFYGRSKRFVGGDPDPGIFEIPGACQKAAVFVNEPLENVERIFHHYRLDVVQLHGDEPPVYCSKLAASGIPVIKAMDPAKISSPEVTGSYAGSVRYFLFDTPGTGYGGTGRQFNWALLEDYRQEIPFILGGGIGPDDAERLLQLQHPGLWGIDLNSRFEITPGVKDVNKLEQFIGQIRKQAL